MIIQLRNALSARTDLSGWLVNETATTSSQAFYVLQKRETTRRAMTREYQVTVYLKTGEHGETIGSSAFAVSRKLSKSELARKIDDAVYAARFVTNPPFDLVPGGKKRTWKDVDDAVDPFDLIDAVAQAFFAAATPQARFNALEVFHVRQTVRILNSRGVDLVKSLHRLDVEAIPSFDGPDRKVEIIRQYSYPRPDLAVIRADAVAAIADVGLRYAAGPVADLAKADVILRDDDVAEFFENLVADFSYDSVYRRMTDRKIGDMVQKEIRGDALTIGWDRTSKADAFDRDGVVLAPVRVVADGRLESFYGANQYAQYLGMAPTGVATTLTAAKGTTGIQAMRKRPHLEILALSGIQIDVYSGYIGGEVRLAVWDDGKRRVPLSGFSFSGNIDRALADLTLSRETTSLVRYRGPRFVRLRDMDIL